MTLNSVCKVNLWLIYYNPGLLMFHQWLNGEINQIYMLKYKNTKISLNYCTLLLQKYPIKGETLRRDNFLNGIYKNKIPRLFML